MSHMSAPDRETKQITYTNYLYRILTQITDKNFVYKVLITIYAEGDKMYKTNVFCM